ncbi:unnamed protein product [Allacma fusca]|uniref:Uncharacterized protein n=1 Tax=Allacma fusca TaxID=39272 RepID=A0A8J2P9Q8_9HEXA|nr:unnamed protein product [Allacma fusca]
MKSILAPFRVLVWIANTVFALVVMTVEGSPPTPGPPIDGGPCVPGWGECHVPRECCSSWCNTNHLFCIGGEVPK